jgi:putative salt-induced outer membrane protein
MKMSQRSAAALVLAAIVPSPPLHAEALPTAVEAMIRQSGANPAVVDAAKATNPNSVAEIDAVVGSMAAAVAAAKDAKMREAGFLANWKGQGEAGFGVTSGNSSETSGYAGIGLVKDDFKLRHKVNIAADYQKSGTPKKTTKERYSASYGLDYKVDDRLYFWGLLGWERDPFAGYSRRLTEGAGVGYRLLNEPDMTLDLEAGPSLRQTKFVTGLSKSALSGRGALAYRWKISSTLAFSEDLTLFVGGGNNTYLTATGLTAALSQDFSARLSYNTQTESKPPFGRKKTDSAIRATLVYNIGE